MNKELSALDPTGRFTNRVDNYVKYRPSYPQTIIRFFQQQFQLPDQAVIADVGAGTGIFSALLLQHGFTVMGVEPNDAMRQAAEASLSSWTNFSSIRGQGEQTHLPDHSIDLITVAQAFHWMDPIATKQEFERILKPGGHIALIWNIRLEDTPFLKAYEQLKSRYSTGYPTSGRDIQEVLVRFFAPALLQCTVFPYEEAMNFEALKGQLVSASYIPLPDHPKYEAMITDLKALFEQHQELGLIRMRYETKLYWAFQA